MNNYFNTTTKVLVYGTGSVAEKTIEKLVGYNVVGVADRKLKSGSFMSIHIVDLNELKKEDVEVIVIASSYKYKREIYERLEEKCLKNGWRLYDNCGRNLADYFGISGIKTSNSAYFDVNYDDLKYQISVHDCISFDLFDTLIMRKVLYTDDIFGVFEEGLRKKNIYIDNYVDLRIQAEKVERNGDIFSIYDRLQQMTGITDETKKRAIDNEIDCEKRLIVIRKDMKELFDYAVSCKKTVSIISDMYLPQSVIEVLLKELGIVGYKAVYISCQEGVSKSTGLFERYRRTTEGKKFLHIGDNSYADGECAKEAGIDTFLIKSAFNMLKVSSLNPLGYVSMSRMEHMITGYILSYLFNSPFALYRTYGKIRINSFEMLGSAFVLPILIYYYLRILECCSKEEFDSVLLVSRDCYLVYRLMQELSKNTSRNAINAKYIYASRKICLRGCISSEADFELLNAFIVDNRWKEFLREYFGDVYKNNDSLEMWSDKESAIEAKKNEIVEASKKTRENYRQYLKDIGVDVSKKVLICDFIAQGTVQQMFKTMEIDTKGCYFAKVKGKKNYELDYFSTVNSLFMDVIHAYDPELESLFSSLEPTVLGINEDKSFVFKQDGRDRNIIAELNKLFDMVVSDVVEIFEFFDRKEITESFIDHILACADLFNYSEDMEKVAFSCEA